MLYDREGNSKCVLIGKFFYCVLDSECDVELYDNYTKCGYMHTKMANLVIIQSHRCMHTHLFGSDFLTHDHINLHITDAQYLF